MTLTEEVTVEKSEVEKESIAVPNGPDEGVASPSNAGVWDLEEDWRSQADGFYR